MLAIRPFFINFNTVIDNIKIRNVTFINVFIYAYIFCALIDIYYGSSRAIMNIVSGEWSSTRNDLYAGDVQLYNNQLQRFAMIFVGYFKPLAIIIFFVGMMIDAVKTKWILLLFLSITISTFVISINTASRGMLVGLFASLFCGFILFKNRLPNYWKKTIYILGSSLVGVSLIYALAVTESRFGESNQSSSLLFYFGHSMLTFNYGLTDTISNFANGSYFFDSFVNIFKFDRFVTSDLGTHFGTNFFTFVGAWYIDFGPNGTFLIALIIPLYFKRVLKRKVVGIAELFISFVYLNYLFMGVFVIGRGNALVWIISFIIYGFLKIKKI
jgi:oligosaccharide repeat unit polymerase